MEERGETRKRKRERKSLFKRGREAQPPNFSLSLCLVLLLVPNYKYIDFT